MGKKRNTILLLVLSALLSCGAGCADLGGLAIGGKASTLGLGGELATGITDNMNARVGMNILDFDLDDMEIDDVEYDIGLDFSSFSALVDWHVFDGSFRITGGVVSMDHELDLEGTGASGETVDIGDGTYDWADIGILSGSAGIDKLAPYVGIGWGDLLSAKKRWGFYFDLGVVFTGSPDVTYTATGAGTTPGLPADLAKERDDIKEELEVFEFYPVISLGLFFQF
jgi:hypothetical protein